MINFLKTPVQSYFNCYE